MDNKWILQQKTSRGPIGSGMDCILQGHRTANHRILLGTIHHSQLVLSRDAWSVRTSSTSKSNCRALQYQQMDSYYVLQQQESIAIVLSPQRTDTPECKVYQYPQKLQGNKTDVPRRFQIRPRVQTHGPTSLVVTTQPHTTAQLCLRHTRQTSSNSNHHRGLQQQTSPALERTLR
jgi:hypothetical protein